MVVAAQPAKASSRSPLPATTQLLRPACLNALEAALRPSCCAAAGLLADAAALRAPARVPTAGVARLPAFDASHAAPAVSSATRRATSREGKSCAGGQASSLARRVRSCGVKLAGVLPGLPLAAAAGSFWSSASSPPVMFES